MQNLDDRFPPGHFDDICIRPLMLYRGQVPSKMRQMRLCHPFFTWWFVLRGEVRLKAGRTWRIREGHWILNPPELLREHDISEETELYSISCEIIWSSGMPLLHLDQPLLRSALPTDPLPSAALSAIVAAEAGCGPGYSHHANRRLSAVDSLMMDGALRLFAGRLVREVVESGAHVRNSTRMDARLQPVLRQLEERPLAGPLPFGLWQEQFGLSRWQLERLARARLGMSLSQWRNRLLARALRRRLLQPGVSIKELAAEFEFVDSAHLHHWGRRHLGQAPSEIRGQSV